MATPTNFLDVRVRNAQRTSVEAGGLDISQVIDSDSILGCDLSVNYEALPFEYNSTTDTIFFNSQDGWSKAMTRVGDWFRLTVSPLDFLSGAIVPMGGNNSTTKTCWISLERNASGVRTSLKSKPFTVNLFRERRFTPFANPGLVAWYDAYDLSSSLALNANVSSWSDKSLGGFDLNQIGTAPTLDKFPNDCPCIKLVTTPVRKLFTTLATLKDPYTIFAAVRYNGISDATFRKFLTTGGTNGVRIGIDNTNIIAKSGAGSTSLAKGTRAADGVAFVVMVKYDHINLVVQCNDVGTGGTGATATSGVANAVTAGTLIIGDDGSDAQGEWQLADLVIYNNASLTTDQVQQQVRALCYQNGITP